MDLNDDSELDDLHPMCMDSTHTVSQPAFHTNPAYDRYECAKSLTSLRHGSLLGSSGGAHMPLLHCLS